MGAPWAVAVVAVKGAAQTAATTSVAVTTLLRVGKRSISGTCFSLGLRVFRPSPNGCGCTIIPSKAPHVRPPTQSEVAVALTLDDHRELWPLLTGIKPPDTSPAAPRLARYR